MIGFFRPYLNTKTNVGPKDGTQIMILTENHASPPHPLFEIAISSLTCQCLKYNQQTIFG